MSRRFLSRFRPLSKRQPPKTPAHSSAVLSSLPFKALTIFTFATLASATTRSDKRGLCFVPNNNHPEDNKIWIQNGSDLTWYCNYGPHPSAVYSALDQNEFEFVPMMWGVSSNPNNTTFLNTVKTLIDSGTNISHALGFNEPNAPSSWGGSDVEPETAAKAWVHNFEPLGKLGVKLGLPAVTGGTGGLPWLQQFLANCSEILTKSAGKDQNCTWDFVPIHWYDNLRALRPKLVSAMPFDKIHSWPDAGIWITEYAYANQDLSSTEETFNTTIEYFDRLDYVERYSYFGAFRSYTSNVGPNAAMLNDKGKLTETGVEYLGLNGTGVKPSAAGLDAVVSWRTLIVGLVGAMSWIAL